MIDETTPAAALVERVAHSFGLRRAPRWWALNAVLAISGCVFMVLLSHRAIPYGSDAGHWLSKYLVPATRRLVTVSVLSACAIAAWYGLSDHWIERRPYFVVSTWLVIGFVFSAYCRSLNPISMERILLSEGCTSFFSAASSHSARDILRHFEALRPSLAIHAASNMPGKTLLFDALIPLSANPAHVALMVVALSALEGALVYAVARRWFKSRRAALLALVLFLLIPSKTNFLPLPNALSAGFVLLPFWLLLLYLDRKRVWLLLLLGSSLYALLLFEPLPFSLGLLFVGALAQRVAKHELAWRSWLNIGLLSVVGFFAVDLAMKRCFGFDALATFHALLADAVDFNVRDARPYDIWIVYNLEEFFLGLSVLSSIVLAFAWYRLGQEHVAMGLVRGWRASARCLLASSSSNLLLGLFATVVILDVLGVNRGEITRLWIFLAVAAAIGVGGFCRTRLGRSSALLLVAGSAVQAMLSTAIVGFLDC